MSKRIFDVILAFFGLLLTSGIILLLLLWAKIDTGGSGIFRQKRVGQFGEIFEIFKIRTMNVKNGQISSFGKFVRKYKLDELPQLVNILKGDMSFVGPRPDIPGYYDRLEGEDRNVLLLKPGLCSRATLKFINEEELLAAQKNPLEYNDEIIFPEKIKLNLQYYHNQSFMEDLKILYLSFKKILIG